VDRSEVATRERERKEFINGKEVRDRTEGAWGELIKREREMGRGE
jgi:hypothetical protein